MGRSWMLIDAVDCRAVEVHAVSVEATCYGVPEVVEVLSIIVAGRTSRKIGGDTRYFVRVIDN